MTTINTSNTTGGTGSTSGTGSASTASDVQNRFLKLLVAQLQNQDPLNPLDNAQITSQMAQLSTVQGIENLNTTLNSLVTSLGDTQAVQSSALIGKTVLVPGSHLTLSKSSAYAGVNLKSAADQVTVSIMDSSGNVIKTQNLGKQDAGNVLFSWDGSTNAGTTAADGSYTYKVTATKGGKTVDAEALQLGTVVALTRTTSGNFVLDLGSLGTFNFEDVQQVY